MSYVTPSARLRALVLYGRDADVTLLARVGPSCALYVDTRAHRARSKHPSTYGLDHEEAFSFYCDNLATSDQAYPLVNAINPYSMHLEHVLPSPMPHLHYLLLAAIETSILGAGEDVLTHWMSTPTLAEELAESFGQSFLSSPFAQAYGPDAKRGQKCTVAEFFLARCVNGGRLYVALMGAEFITQNVSVRVLDQTIAAIANHTKQLAIDASYLPLQVQSELENADSPKIWMGIADKARELVECVARRVPPHAHDWLCSMADEQDTVMDIMFATKGQIEPSSRKRLHHLVARELESESVLAIEAPKSEMPETLAK